MRLGQLQPAPLAGLFLTLTVVFLILAEPSEGFGVWIARSRPLEPCGDTPVYVARVLPNGVVQFSGQQTLTHELEKELNLTFRTRAYRLLFVEADPRVSFQEVVDVIAIASRQLDHVALVTPANTGCPRVNFQLKQVDMFQGEPVPAVKEVPWWPW